MHSSKVGARGFDHAIREVSPAGGNVEACKYSVFSFCSVSHTALTQKLVDGSGWSANFT